ncbi:MAG TPA: hypothetical protein VLX91_16185 [Candidatus Acidoferrales bacterium]|nr:hypothetical protein [Candidatus Acidoferrales bacterium]
MTRAIFIDRDGKINIDKDRLTGSDQVEFIQNSPEAISSANNLGLKVVVISNQSGVARGLVTTGQVDLDLSSSFVVGDKWSNVKYGDNAAAITSLVMTGYGKTDCQRCIDDRIKIDYLAESLYDFVTNFVKKKIEKNN